MAKSKYQNRKLPSFDYEAEYWEQGIELIAGIDEVGMGALAGPVCAAAVIFPPDKGGSAGWRRGVGHIPYKLIFEIRRGITEKIPLHQKNNCGIKYCAISN